MLGKNFKEIFIAVVLVIDIYIFFNLKNTFLATSKYKKEWLLGYCLLSSFLYISYFLLFIIEFKDWAGWSRNIIMGMALSVSVAKIVMIPFFLLGDLVRLYVYITGGSESSVIVQQAGMSRLTFLHKTGLILGGGIFGGFIYGMIRGAYNIKINYINLKINNLHKNFEKLKIVQISDMHTGSYVSAKHLENMVHKINAEEPDFIFFTGDIVNFKADELTPYLPVLGKLKAKNKIYSILGNHDYGTYYDWENEADAQKNIQQLIDYQHQLGWRLLLDEHEIMDIGGQKLAVIGIQYWGRSMRFGQKGNLTKAYAGAEHANLKLLLSHDPSHWDAEVTVDEKFKDIDVTFSGHTHGMQFGVEIPKWHIKWSPVQYIYPHWAGLYKKGKQKLYVNRGIGFVGYPGRLGVPPEITVFSFSAV
jgi:predicted MPP superfamily phosphohydrolase